MGGVETSRDGGATQETTKVVLVELTKNCCGGVSMPIQTYMTLRNDSKATY